MMRKKKRKSIKTGVVQQDVIENMIYLVRGQRVMFDRDLATLYGVQTSRLNEQVKRNKKRFPEDFMFQVSSKEKEEVIANCDNLKTLKFSPANPYVFTEQGVAMLSSVLNSDRAINVNIAIMRTFTKLRSMLAEHKELRQKVKDMEKQYDKKFQVVFVALKELFDKFQESPKPKTSIGFHSKDS